MVNLKKETPSSQDIFKFLKRAEGSSSRGRSSRRLRSQADNFSMEILTQIGYWRRRKNKRALNDIIAEENGSDGIDDPANIDEALDKKLTENQVLGRKRLRVAELKLKQCLDELFVSDKGDENEEIPLFHGKMELDHFKRLIKRKGQLGLLCEVTDNERDFFIGLILAKEMYEQKTKDFVNRELQNNPGSIDTSPDDIRAFLDM